ncbi:hypothetical protein L210DRAFT_2731264 [Boletus edulis BED1]|uniref:Uncharacterized protein n=1 Tax=Boletus edulis BED1 TaxID=1328754 RepID=A0AAD4G647_BOLED|nr:hypothetical protein L210DRAFT_2731264 [Boletus edulis BED1]
MRETFHLEGTKTDATRALVACILSSIALCLSTRPRGWLSCNLRKFKEMMVPLNEVVVLSADTPTQPPCTDILSMVQNVQILELQLENIHRFALIIPRRLTLTS